MLDVSNVWVQSLVEGLSNEIEVVQLDLIEEDLFEDVALEDSLVHFVSDFDKGGLQGEIRVHIQVQENGVVDQ